MSAFPGFFGIVEKPRNQETGYLGEMQQSGPGVLAMGTDNYWFQGRFIVQEWAIKCHKIDKRANVDRFGTFLSETIDLG